MYAHDASIDLHHITSRLLPEVNCRHVHVKNRSVLVKLGLREIKCVLSKTDGQLNHLRGEAQRGCDKNDRIKKVGEYQMNKTAYELNTARERCESGPLFRMLDGVNSSSK